MTRIKILKQIKQHSLLFYKQSTSQILPQFARTLLTFLQYLHPLKELIYKTLLNENDRLAEKFKEYLIEFRLEEKMQLKKQNFTYDKIQTRLFNTVALRTETEILNKEFAEFIKLFSGPEFSTFDSEFTALEHFISLCRHDFIRLLMYFDPDITLSPRYKPRFAPCIGHHANQDLMDLFFIFAELNMILGIDKNSSESDIKKAYFNLVKRFTPEKHGDQFKQIRGAYDQLKDSTKRVEANMFIFSDPYKEFVIEEPEEEHQYSARIEVDHIFDSMVQMFSDLNKTDFSDDFNTVK